MFLGDREGAGRINPSTLASSRSPHYQGYKRTKFGKMYFA